MNGFLQQSLPVDGVIDDLRRALAGHAAAVLQAPAGAGKTTRVPPALLGEAWLQGRRVVMLEPRRLAARAAAAHMARRCGEPVGRTVGYRVRMDTRVGARTRIEVVTEAVLTRMVQSDAALSGIGLVIFDEFHERHLHTDLGLALCLDLQGALRPDLRLLIMSATLDSARVAERLGGVPVIRAEGRRYPVATRYRPIAPDRPLEGPVADAVFLASRRETGDILVFLPGAAEIGRVARRLDSAGLDPQWEVHRLHGAAAPRRQEQAVSPAPPGRRKVVLATNIAETSLTIEGIGVVVDSGWMRVPRFDPRTAMTRLQTVKVSRASADQRRGRAGRTGPGVCIRLWDESADKSLPARGVPEILEADLASLALELALWGVPDPASLSWLDPPPAGAFQQAQALLTDLGAIDAERRVTKKGRRMAGLGVHPRLGRMVLDGAAQGLAATACAVAGLLEERDVFGPGREPRDSDIRLRLEVLEQMRGAGDPSGAGPIVNRGRCRQILRIARRMSQRFDAAFGPLRPAAAGRLLALAYPDRIAMAVEGSHGRFRLSGGGRARFAGPEPLGGEPFLVAAELDGRRPEAVIFLAAAYDRPTLEEQFADRIDVEDTVRFDEKTRSVRCRRRRRLASLVLDEAPIADPPAEAVRSALIDGIRRLGIGALPWTGELRNWRRRVSFLEAVFPEDGWPDLSDAFLLDTLEHWLGPHVDGLLRLNDFKAARLKRALLALLDGRQHGRLEQLAPVRLTVPSGFQRPLDYTGPVPVLAVKLQEMFGAAATPAVAGGKVPVLLHLLSPAGRPVQVTRDLEGFWKTGYAAVKKEMKGRYPKHPWPDDPLAAKPTPGTRRKTVMTK